MNVEELLAPVSEDKPCGEDVSDDPRLQHLVMRLDAYAANKARGLELAEDPNKPNWHKNVDTCEELFRESKHLQVAVLLCLGWLKLEGLGGFLKGLRLIHGLVDQYWPTLYPGAEDEDERLNIIENLAAPIGQEGDYYEFMFSLRETRLSESRLGIATIAGAFGETVPGDAQLEDLDIAKIPGDIAIALKDTQENKPEYFEETHRLANEALEAVVTLDACLRGGERFGVNAPSWGPLNQNLSAIKKLIGGFRPVEEEPAAAEEGSAQEGGTAQPKRAGGLSGTIDSKKDVRRALQEIIKYYERRDADDDAEKSPVPLMARGTLRTMDMGFREMLDIFTRDTYQVLDKIAGEDAHN